MSPKDAEAWSYCVCTFHLCVAAARAGVSLLLSGTRTSRRSTSRLRLPRAPRACPSGSGAAAGPRPTCVRPAAAAPGRLRPATGPGRAARGRTPAAQLRRDSSLWKNFPPENPCARTSLPHRGGFDFSGFSSFYFPSACAAFGRAADLQLARVHVSGGRPCSRLPSHHALRGRRIPGR